MKNKKEIREELQEQIRKVSMRLNIQPVQQDAQKLIDMLGGDAKVSVGDDAGAVCYYITLLFLNKQLQDAK